jgi:hypothetical protein
LCLVGGVVYPQTMYEILSIANQYACTGATILFDDSLALFTVSVY